MDFKGTKGNWQVVKGSDSIWIESEIWSIADINKKDTFEEQLSNAKLIAAAPDLLKALQFILESKSNMKHYLNFDDSLMEAIEQAEKAIEKALK